MSELKPIQQRAIAALLSMRTNADAAAHVHVSERQLYRWLRDENFRAHLERAESQLVQDVTRRFSSLLGNAVESLETLLQEQNLSAGDRLRVVRTVLELYPRLREIASFEQRLEALERALGNVN